MIGVLGGTFNPVHYGHLRAAIEVKEFFGLQELRLIPSAQPPHRPQPEVSALMRLEMLALAVNNQPGFIVDPREIHRAGQSYMIDTLRSLQGDFPDQALLLIIGMDAFEKLSTWRQWQQLFDVAHIVVMTRPSYPIPELEPFLSEHLVAQADVLAAKQAGCLYFLPITALAISATVIRTIVAQRKNPRFLLPDAVIDYIKLHGLYLRP